MFLEKFAGGLYRMGNDRCDVTADVQQHLLKNGGVEPCSGDADFIEPMPVADGRLGQSDAFPCREAATDNQTHSAAVAFEMNHQLTKLAHPPRAGIGFFWSEKTSTEGHDVNRAHDSSPSRPCFHPIPPQMQHHAKTR